MKPKKRGHDRMLLILDLDETLIHASETALDRPADFIVYDYHVYRRPFLAEFLTEMALHFELAVWSSASDDYVRAVVQCIFPDPARLHFIWGRSRATLRRHSWDENGYMHDAWDHLHYLKPLTKVRKAGWTLDRVLIVDDTPQKCVRNYGNAVYPHPYEGAPDDCELRLLSHYLISLKDMPNVRTIEKRRWRDALSKLIP